jgi:hypothetical protein
MVKVKCPKCGMKYQFVQCNNCGSRDGTLRSVIVLSESDAGDPGAFRKKCNGGRTALDYEGGYFIRGSLFKDSGFLMYTTFHDREANVVS